VELRDRRLMLTLTAKSLLKHVRALLASGQNQGADADAVETVTVALADDLDAEIQTVLTGAFVREYADEPVALRFQPLDPETVVPAIRTGTVAFAVGWEGDAVGGERLDSGLPWTLLVPLGSTLAGSGSAVTAGDLAAGRVFLPPRCLVAPHISALLEAVPPTKRVEVDSAHAARAMVAAGLGVCLDIDFGLHPLGALEPWVRRPIEGLQPEHLCLIQPRNPDELLYAPAQTLIGSLRRVLHPQEAMIPLPIDTIPEPPLPELPYPE
jgi:DNA-binding transcriptional LysR family regulator